MLPIEKKHPTIGDYVLVKTLGAGYNSKVKLGYNTKDGKYYAVKVMKRTNIIANEKAIKTEVGIMKNLSHKNLINLIDFQEVGDYHKTNGSTFQVMFVVLELATGGELFEYVASTGRFTESVARTYFHQLIDALDYLHSNNIAHRDLKPENLLFDEGFNLKLADFGFSTHIEKDELKTILGTEAYMAPEIHARQKYSGRSVDLFAAGIILFIMYSGSPPFSRADPRDPYYKLHITGKLDTFWQAHSKHRNNKEFYSESFKDLINLMFSYNPELRPTIEQIRKHPWFTGDILMMDDIRTEFNKRKERVDKEVEKQRIEKNLEKERQKGKMHGNLAYTGMKGFRSLGKDTKEFKDVDALFGEELKLERSLNVLEKDSPINPQNIFSVCDADYLFRVVLDALLAVKGEKVNDYKAEKINLDAKKYKIMAQIFDKKNESFVEINFGLSKVDEETNIIEFNKKKGNAITYFDSIEKIKSLIEKQLNGAKN